MFPSLYLTVHALRLYIKSMSRYRSDVVRVVPLSPPATVSPPLEVFLKKKLQQVGRGQQQRTRKLAYICV